jgi:hypothetical protein
MSEELSAALRLCSILRGRPARNSCDWDAAATIERLIRERDEALAECRAAKHSMLATIQTQITENKKAEQYGRAKAIEEAVAVVSDWKGGSYMVAFSEIRRQMIASILALKDKPAT